MKRLLIAFISTLIAFAPTTSHAADTASADQTMAFSDGSKGLSYNHCGVSDLCALIEYADGEKLSIYSEGAAYCQPYELHYVKTNGTATVYEYSRTINHDLPTTNALGVHCGQSRDTQMVLDHGLIHMTVSENHDGTLSIVFSPTEQGAARRQSQDDPTPEATP